MALWVADGEMGLMCGEERLCRRAAALSVCGDLLICASQDGAHAYTAQGEERAVYSLPPGVCRLCALPDALYALSSEADSVSLLCPRTGRLRLCAQAGCYPRDMMLSPCGGYLLIAGGASGEALVMTARELRLVGRYALPGIVCAAAFGAREIFALCAVEDNDISAQVLRISPRGVKSEAARFAGLPGALRALPDGSVLCGIAGETLRMRADGRILQRYPGGLVQSIRVLKSCALTADPLAGCVMQVHFGVGKSAGAIYRGAAPNDVLAF